MQVEAAVAGGIVVAARGGARLDQVAHVVVVTRGVDGSQFGGMKEGNCLILGCGGGGPSAAARTTTNATTFRRGSVCVMTVATCPTTTTRVRSWIGKERRRRRRRRRGKL